MNKNALVLAGSAEIVAQFFEVCMNSILFQRQIYPPSYFKSEIKWGLPQMMAASVNLVKYIQQILSQLRVWLKDGSITQLTMTIVDLSNTAVEAWRFAVRLDSSSGAHHVPTDTNIEENLRAVLRQIAMSVSFLPVLTDSEYTFYVSVTEHDEKQTPANWVEADPRNVPEAQRVTFKPLETGEYSVDIAVEYMRPTL